MKQQPRAQKVGPRNALPRYVDRGGETVYAQPHAAIGMRMYCFAIDIDSARVDVKAARELNDPTGGLEVFKSAGRAALLNFVDISCITPDEPPDSWLGYLPEKECSIWVPLADLKRRQLLWSVPYMFVDSGPAMSGGREIFGFPKQYGWVDVERGSTAPESFSLSTVALAQNGPDERADRQELITVTRPQSPQVPLTSVATNGGLLLEHLFAHDASAELQARGRNRLLHDLLSMRDPLPAMSASEVAFLFVGQVLDMHLPMVLLKQFRDIVDPWSACYLGVVKVTNEINIFRHGGLLPDDYTINVADLAGEPIRRELGLADDPIVPWVAFWLEFDFVVGAGEVLWDSLGRSI
jgi:hypothetical protein